MSMSLAMLSLGVAVLQKMGYLYTGAEGLSLNRNVLVLFAMMLFLMTVMFIMMGVISELLVRIYHESQGMAPYRIRRIVRQTATEAGDAAPSSPLPVVSAARAE
jgi:O-antigen/teichoic acid export membrane protein